MKLLVALALIGVVAGDVFQSPIELDYHGKIGIPLAARIKAAEEALDFDGSRIVGGSAAALGQFPYVAGLLIHMPNGGTSVCTSSLLSASRSVTAAHCWRGILFRPTAFTVVLGSTTLFSGGTRVTTSDVVTHEHHNVLSLANDIALVRFPAVTLNNNIQPIALATGSNDFVGTWSIAAGFGLTQDGGSITSSQFLSWVSVQVVPNAVCLAVYGDWYVFGSTICVATTGGRGTCGGDSGGPLVANNQLIGVTSFGHRDGCESGHPAGFGRITTHAAWLQARL